MNKVEGHIREYWHYYVLCLLPIVAYWQIAGGQNVMKFDAVDITYPLKYLTSVYYTNGIFPEWNPHINLGLPIYSDPGSQIYYPLYWINMLVTGYSVNGHQWDLIIHLMIAGIGMYKLLKSVEIQKDAAFLFAAVYLLNGAFMANAQHMGWIISASWMPWVWYYFLKIWHKPSDTNAVKLGLSLYLMLVSAYPVFAMINFYLLGGWSAVVLIQRKGRRFPWRSMFFASIGFLPYAGSYVNSVLEGTQYFNRGQGITVDQLSAGSLSWQGLESVVSPLLNGLYPSETTGYIPSMNLMFIGLIPLICFVGYFSLSSRDKRLTAFFWLALLCLAMAMADLLPLRRWAYYVLPGFDSFKFPGIFRHFAIFFLIPVAAFFFQNIFKHGLAPYNLRRKISLVLTAILLIGLPWFGILDMNAYSPTNDQLWMLIPALVFPIMGLLLLFSPKSKWRNWVLPVMILELIFGIQLGMPAHVVSDVKVSMFQSTIDKYDKSYNDIDFDRPMLEMNTYSTKVFKPMVYNDCFIKKEFAHDGFYPLQLKSLQAFARDPNYWTILEQPFLFFSSTLNGLPVNTQMASAKVIEYFPNKMRFEIHTPEKSNLIVFQNILPGWKASIDNKPVTLDTAFHTLISIPVTPEDEIVELVFKSGKKFQHHVSLGLFFVVVMAGLFFEVKGRYIS